MSSAATIRILRPDAAAEVLNLSVSTLAKMRMRGDGPPFVKLGSRAVGYRSSDLLTWLDDAHRISTHD